MAKTINCCEVKARLKSVPTNETSVKRINSFLTIPNKRRTPAKAGKPNQPTVKGVKRFPMKSKIPHTYKTCIMAPPIIKIGNTR